MKAKIMVLGEYKEDKYFSNHNDSQLFKNIFTILKIQKHLV
jgi:hypothetical protein